MAKFEINKGVGHKVEFKGLQAQYLFIFAGGLLALLVLVLILYLCSIDEYLCLFIGVLGAALLVWQTFAMNKTYGTYGLMKRRARRFQRGAILARHTLRNSLFIRSQKPKL